MVGEGGDELGKEMGRPPMRENWGGWAGEAAPGGHCAVKAPQDESHKVRKARRPGNE